MKRFTYRFFVALVVLQSTVGTVACKAKNSGQDVFCEIIQGRGPATILYQTNDIVIIKKRHIHPDVVDCLIIPKKHVQNIKDLDLRDTDDAQLGSKMFAVAQTLSQQLQAPGDFTITMNNGATSHQTVFHMHMHFKSPQRWKESFRKTFRVQVGSGRIKNLYV